VRVAGHSAQIYPNGFELIVGHMSVYGPRHYLKHSAVNGRVVAIVGHGFGTVWVQFVKVMPGAHNRLEFLKIITAFRIASVIGRQIARDDVRPETRAAV
jgi:hypothetical protein